MIKSSPRIAIMGAGGIGGSIGAYLTCAGHDVTLIDQWSEHVAQMQQEGLTLTNVNERFTVPVKAIHLSDANRIRDPFDVVMLCVKSYDIVWSAHFIEPHLAPSGFAMAVMNALNDETVAQIMGYPRTVGCVTAISAGIYEPGHVVRTDPITTHAFTVGELHGIITSRVEQMAAMFGVMGPSETTANIWGARWSKMVWNCMGNAMAGILGPDTLLTPYQRDARGLLCAAAGGEAARVARAIGVHLEPFEGMDLNAMAGALARTELARVAEQVAVASARRDLTAEQRAHLGVPSRPSLLQDVIKGRRTEVDYLNGHIVAKGRELGIATPVNAAITEVMHRIETESAEPGVQHLDALAELLPG